MELEFEMNVMEETYYEEHHWRTEEPDTGVRANVMMLASLMTISAIGIVGTITLRRKEEQ